MNSKKLFVLSVIAILVIYALLGFWVGYTFIFKIFKVPMGEKIFIDLRIITAGAELYAKGLDPALYNPYFSSFTYPHIWYIILATGIKEAHTVMIGIGMAILFFIAASMLPGKIESLGVMMLLFALFSPASMLAVERGNVDLIFFVIIVLALFSVSLPWLSALLLLIASLFKLYPIFALGYFIDDEKKEFLKPALVVLGCFLAYIILTYQDMLHVFSTTAKGDNYSYGVAVIALKIANEIPSMTKIVYLGFYLLAIVGGLFVFWMAVKRNQAILTTDRRNFQSFKAGAAIYLGTFLLGNNWDYRLIFLILIIPQLSMWVKSPQSNIKWSSIVASFSAFFSLWYIFIYNFAGNYFVKAYLPIYLMDQLSQWILFFSLAYLLSASLPKWIFSLRPRDSFISNLVFHVNSIKLISRRET